jgi:ABC-type phosphate transport system ATPase subunit
MNLAQFDKLKELVKEVLIKLRQLKYKNIKLEKENIKLKNRLQTFEQLPGEFDVSIYENLKSENERLKNKNQKVNLHLQKLVSQLEQKAFQSNGVDL